MRSCQPSQAFCRFSNCSFCSIKISPKLRLLFRSVSFDRCERRSVSCDLLAKSSKFAGCKSTCDFSALMQKRIQLRGRICQSNGTPTNRKCSRLNNDDSSSDSKSPPTSKVEEKRRSSTIEKFSNLEVGQISKEEEGEVALWVAEAKPLVLAQSYPLVTVIRHQLISQNLARVSF